MTYNFSEEEYKEYMALKENANRLDEVVFWGGDSSNPYIRYRVFSKDETLKNIAVQLVQANMKYDKLYRKVRGFAELNVYRQKQILKKGFILGYFFNDEKEVSK